jgi:hypothetical protein
MRSPTFPKWMKGPCVLPNLQKSDPPAMERTEIDEGRGMRGFVRPLKQKARVGEREAVAVR